MEFIFAFGAHLGGSNFIGQTAELAEIGYFICHHKAGAGSFARLLKMQLTITPGAKPRPFIDSDDLKDLGKLFEYVGNQTAMFLILCSKEILSRPWCLGEIVTARAKRVGTLSVVFQDFALPTPEYIRTYAEHVGDLSGLTERGIRLSRIQDALNSLASLPHIDVPATLGQDTMVEVSENIVKGVATSMVIRSHADADVVRIQSVAPKTFILPDISNMEAVATAFVLKMLLTSRLSHTPDLVPHVVTFETPADIRTILIVCTDGAFQHAHMLRVLMFAGTRHAKYVPILASDAFRFPSKDFLEENRQAFEAMNLHADADAIAKIVADVFKSIAVVFEPQAYSSTEEVLAAKADAIAERCTKQSLLKELSFEVTASTRADNTGDARQDMGELRDL